MKQVLFSSLIFSIVLLMTILTDAQVKKEETAASTENQVKIEETAALTGKIVIA
ncbi:MAG: hypothetical protein HQK67_02455, partial [Desulfamplus sp.]|nr:hypothetical protein [Desulfamplus sp.]